MMMVLVGNVVVWLCGDWVMVVDVDVDLGDLLVRFSECGGLQINIEYFVLLQYIKCYVDVCVYMVMNKDWLEMFGVQNDL